MSEYYNLRRFLETLSGQHEGYALSCLPSSEDPRDYKYIRLFGSTDSLEPETIDYRSSLPGVFDQGQRGSCVACACAWTLKAYEEIKQGDYPPGGMSAAFLYTLCKQIDGLPDQEGTTPRSALQVLRKVGICKEELMPYSTLSSLPAPRVPSPTPEALSAASSFRIQTYAQLCAYNDRDRSQMVNTMRQALKEQGPFIMALLICSNFKPDKDGFLPVPEGGVQGGHAVGIVGDLPDQQAFILRNSWGRSWGLDGYAYLPYEWVASRGPGGWTVFEAWTAVDTVLAPPAGRIEICPGLKTILVDGVQTSLDETAIMSNNRLMVPVRDLAAAMGYRVSWYGRKVMLIKPS